jgi:antitoxin ParD1/3/4
MNLFQRFGDSSVTWGNFVPNIDNIQHARHPNGRHWETNMASESIHVRVTGPLQDHVQQQIGQDGLYENASEYIRALIRRDLQSGTEAWDWLQKKLEPALRADESEFAPVSSEDVIRRNPSR